MHEHTSIAPCGGMAFEGYAELLSNKHGMRTWRKFRKCKAAGNAEPQAAALFPAVVDSLIDQYYGFVMQSVASMHMPARNQRFYPTLVASYHGLSLMGMDILSSYGFTMPSSSFLRQRKVALEHHDTTIRYPHDSYYRTLPSLPSVGTWKRRRMSHGGTTSRNFSEYDLQTWTERCWRTHCGPVLRFASTRAQCLSTCDVYTLVATSYRPCLSTHGRRSGMFSPCSTCFVRLEAICQCCSKEARCMSGESAPFLSHPRPTTCRRRCRRGWPRLPLGCTTSIPRASCHTTSVQTRD